MSASSNWAVETLIASGLLMLAVLLLRHPVRRVFGPHIAYALWALPALRMLLPPLPAGISATPLVRAGERMTVLVAGQGSVGAAADHLPSLAHLAILVWAIGAVAVFGWHVLRHVRFCRRLIAAGTPLRHDGAITLIVTDVAGPLAFGIVRRFVAVPRDFAERYDRAEQRLVLAHEYGHHARGDLLAKWIALVLLALHWFDPIAWTAFAAFCADQEFANDARVLAGRDAADRARYARVLVKASGIDVAPACNLHSRANLKGRLTMLARTPVSTRRFIIGGAAVALLAGTALAATASGAAHGAPAAQARTIIIKPSGADAFTLIVHGTELAPGAPLPGGRMLPADFEGSGGCKLGAQAMPIAYVIKGDHGVADYTVLCAGGATATTKAAVTEAIASLKTVRRSIVAQRQPPMTDADRAEALAAVDGSTRELEGDLAQID